MNIEIDKIISLFKKNNFTGAKKLCEQLENNFINDANFYLLYGVVLFQLGNIRESIKKFDCEILYQNNRGYGDALIHGINNVKTELFCIFNADGSFEKNDSGIMLWLIQETTFFSSRSNRKYISIESFKRSLI